MTDRNALLDTKLVHRSGLVRSISPVHRSGLVKQSWSQFWSGQADLSSGIVRSGQVELSSSRPVLKQTCTEICSSKLILRSGMQQTYKSRHEVLSARDKVNLQFSKVNPQSSRSQGRTALICTWPRENKQETNNIPFSILTIHKHLFSILFSL